MWFLHKLANLVGLPQDSRNQLVARWRRLIRWKPEYYRRACEFGLNTEMRERKIIVSLTSYPARISTVDQTINTLLTQTMKPDKVILWLARQQFPQGNDGLPTRLRELMAYGLSIQWCDDLRSYKKLLPALKEYPNDFVITVDDDMFYPPDMVERLLASYHANGVSVCTFSGMRIEVDRDGNVIPYRKWHYVQKPGVGSFANLILGGSGTLYPSWLVTDEIFNQDAWQELTPTTDDIWFWAMAVLSNLKICVIHGGGCGCDTNHNANYDCALWNDNQKDDGGNDCQFRRLLDAYPVVRERLMQDVV